MPAPLALALLLASAPTPSAAVDAALGAPGSTAEIMELRPGPGGGCAAERWEALQPVEASGQAALRYDGRTAQGGPCQGFAWARVRVLAPSAVTTRALRQGEPLRGAVALAPREVRAGHHPLAELPEGAVADRPLAAGALLEAEAIRVGPRSGEPITVRLRRGALEVEQVGRAVPCARDRACALLPSGRRVEGRLLDGRLQVELP